METPKIKAVHVKNIMFSVAGTAIPLVAGIVAVPLLLAGLGKEKLGLFTLALALFGFTGLFDLGLGRSLTRTVAHEIGRGRPSAEVAGLIRRGLTAIVTLGVIWGAAILVAAPYFARALNLQDPSLRAEVADCVRVISVLVPFALLASGINGVLEGVRAFSTVNAIRAPIGVATYIAPALAGLETHSLFYSVLALSLVRLAGLFALWMSLSRVFPRFWSAPRTDAGALWRYSGWLTVSNVIAPLMTTADRYYLAMVFPPAAIASYTVAFDAIYRLTAFPFAAIGAVFPSLSSPRKTEEELRQILDLAIRGGIAFWVSPLLLGAMFVEQILSVWIGADFAATSANIARWIIAGILVNGFSLIPFVMLQADGRVRTTIKFHMIEMLPYAGMLLILTKSFGIAGAAAAWTMRVVVDAFLQFGAARRLHAHARTQLDRLMFLAIAGLALVFVAVQLSLPARLALTPLLVLWAIVTASKIFRDAKRG